MTEFNPAQIGGYIQDVFRLASTSPLSKAMKRGYEQGGINLSKIPEVNLEGFMRHDVNHILWEYITGSAVLPQFVAEPFANLPEGIALAHSLGIEPTSKKGLELMKLAQMGSSYVASYFEFPRFGFPDGVQGHFRTIPLKEHLNFVNNIFPNNTLERTTKYVAGLTDELSDRLASRQKVLYFPVQTMPPEGTFLKEFANSGKSLNACSEEELQQLFGAYHSYRGKTVLGEVMNQRNMDYSLLPSLSKKSPEERLAEFNKQTGWEGVTPQSVQGTWLPEELKQEIQEQRNKQTAMLAENQASWNSTNK